MPAGWCPPTTRGDSPRRSPTCSPTRHSASRCATPAGRRHDGSAGRTPRDRCARPGASPCERAAPPWLIARSRSPSTAASWSGQPTGVGRYLFEVLRGSGPPIATVRHTFHVVLPTPPPPALPALGPRIRWRVERRGRRGHAGGSRRACRAPLAQRAARRLLRRRTTRRRCALPCPLVVAIYDVSFFAHPEWFGRARRLAAPVADARRRRDARATVVTISEFSRAEIVRWLERPARPDSPRAAGRTAAVRPAGRIRAEPRRALRRLAVQSPAHSRPDPTAFALAAPRVPGRAARPGRRQPHVAPDRSARDRGPPRHRRPRRLARVRERRRTRRRCTTGARRSPSCPTTRASA